ncbi:MAG: DUF808 domain-containing protein [Porticoccaceae bacterium]|nr:DUF808 domain-containing protein [Porticoccaceae bacterium]
MATGILAILDDVAMLLDDAAAMGKVAAKKTAGLLGDDLAVNAEKATGFHASRELPVIWEITKGSILNKIIILPCALLLNAYLPWMLVPILLLGASYLCYEGAEHVIHWLFHHEDEQSSEHKTAKISEPAKIKSAIRTDFILSIEIIVITLAAVVGQSIAVQVLVVCGISLLATAGVYGLVALIVRLDDMGLFLLEKSEQMEGVLKKFISSVGSGLVALLPKIVKLLSIVGTLAMLMVGGGILVHYIEAVHHALEALPSLIGDLVAGGMLGTFIYILISLASRFRGAQKASSS